MTIQIKRVYEQHVPSDGTRLLVERLWPRGLTKAKVGSDAWLKDVAPSSELRKWFDHAPERWIEFKRRYRAELAANPQAWAPILEQAGRGAVTLLYSSHDVHHNNAVVLRDFLNARLKAADARRSPPRRSTVYEP
jgi:uncharacterized protein YeaO (DUF488 family)